MFLKDYSKWYQFSQGLLNLLNYFDELSSWAKYAVLLKRDISSLLGSWSKSNIK